MNGELSRHGIKNECNIVVEAVNSLVSSVTIDKFIPSLEVPKYIRDIKDEAHTLFGSEGNQSAKPILRWETTVYGFL